MSNANRDFSILGDSGPKRLPKIGIVGHEAAKFTPATKAIAQIYIRNLLREPCVVVSGHCHLGGIDIWAEEIAAELEREIEIFPPKNQAWATGYKPRNEQIAQTSDKIVSIVVKEYPAGFKGRRFPICYHCGTKTHVKSGGCWTVKYARSLGKYGWIHEIEEPL